MGYPNTDPNLPITLTLNSGGGPSASWDLQTRQRAGGPDQLL